MPEELVDASGENIFLVDHSEYAQAVDGMEDAHIVGVLDHHGIGNIATGHQIVYEAKPIGATATIVWLDYMNYGFEIDKQTAYLLLGAVLSDTSNCTISTTTDADRKAVPALAQLAGVDDTDALYKEIHERAMSYDGMSDMEIMFSDYKEYEASGVKYGIGLINSTNEETSKELAERMKNVAEEAMASRDVQYMFASVGIREGDVKTDYIVPMSEESKELMEAAFPHYDEYDGTSYIFRNGGLGRKSKFVPGLNDYFAAHPHE
jgi:manganese-dependent inorganic pyrophosphatase